MAERRVSPLSKGGQGGFGFSAAVYQATKSRRLAKLLAQGLHHIRLAADVEKRAIAVGALLQHFTAGEDFPARLPRVDPLLQGGNQIA